MENTVWVLTEEYNQYDQYGEYFCAVFKEKPTLEQLTEIGVTEDYAVHCIENEGGRLYGGRVYESGWWYLREVEFNKYYSED